MKSRGFSLTELLVVVVIVALLAGLVFPVFVRAKDYSKTVPCTSNLRQIYVAWSIYQSDYDGVMPRGLVQVAEHVPTVKAVFACPADASAGANLDDTKRLGKTSYFALWPMPDFRQALEQADPNHGIVYCVLHGTRVPLAEFAAVRDTRGLVLRLRRDGSIQRAQVGTWCGPPTPNGRMEGRQQWSLVSDTHCVEPFCFGLSEPCS